MGPIAGTERIEVVSMTIGDLPEVVSREEWLAARWGLLEKEKELTRARDRLTPSAAGCRWSSWTSRTPSKARTGRSVSSTEAGMPWAEGMRGDYPGISAFLRVGDEVFHTYSTFGRGIERFHYGIPYLDLTALGRQEEWEEPQGRAEPLGLQASGPNMRLPDEYDT